MKKVPRCISTERSRRFQELLQKHSKIPNRPVTKSENIDHMIVTQDLLRERYDTSRQVTVNTVSTVQHLQTKLYQSLLEHITHSRNTRSIWLTWARSQSSRAWQEELQVHSLCHGCVHWFSRYLWLLPLSTKSSRYIARELKKTYERDGPSDRLQSDQGLEFYGRVENTCKKYKIRRSRPYHA